MAADLSGVRAVTEDALIRQHARLAYAIARDFYFPGADHDDVDQEALFGLLKAIRDYDQSQDVPFAPFAALCIRRHLIVSVPHVSLHRSGITDDQVAALLAAGETQRQIVARGVSGHRVCRIRRAAA